MLEDLLRDRLTRLGFIEDGDELAKAIDRVEVGRDKILIALAHIDRRMALNLGRLGPSHDLEMQGDGGVLTIGVTLKRRGGSKHAIGPDGDAAVNRRKVEFALLKALVKAEAWKTKLLQDGMSFEAVVNEDGLNRGYAQRIIRLAFLSPQIKRSILEGRTPAGMNLQRMIEGDIPLSWSDQRPR